MLREMGLGVSTILGSRYRCAADGYWTSEWYTLRFPRRNIQDATFLYGASKNKAVLFTRPYQVELGHELASRLSPDTHTRTR